MLTRLQRFLADCGIASRRECEAMIAAGRVRVNGDVRTEMPVMIDPAKDVVSVDDETVGLAPVGLREQKQVYFLLNKPKGILVTNKDPANRKTVSELMAGVKERVFPVGRLDMDARGALLMTNDGELANRLTHPRYGIEKTYIVEVDGRIGHGEIEKIKRGVWLGALTRGAPSAPRMPGREEHGGRRDAPAGGRPAPAGATRTEGFHVKLVGRERGRTILELKLTEAKNSDIRRVMARIGHTVRDLNRVAIAGKITLKGLDVGKHRPLTEAEVKWLYHASSEEFHGQKQAATQQWYEAKEMEKERKRLEAEAEMPEREAAAAPAPVKTKIDTRKPKERSPRPERKGKKPFVPPSGRNAGKALGGNYIGKRRLDAEVEATQDDSPLPSHPLGYDATSDD